jgi:hypothetical protein
MLAFFSIVKAGFRKLNLETLLYRAVVAILSQMLVVIFAKGLP